MGAPEGEKTAEARVAEEAKEAWLARGWLDEMKGGA